MRSLNEMSDDRGADALVDSPPISPGAGNPQPVPVGRTTRPVPQSPSSFSDFLSSSQMAAATPPKPPQKQSSNRGSGFSLKRTAASVLAFRSTKQKDKSKTLPSFSSSGTNEWGVVQSPQSAKF